MELVEKPAITLENLTFSYTPGFNILQDVSVTFPEKKFSILLGSNGSGKSTFFKILAGLQKNFSGNLFFFGEKFSTLPSLTKAKTVGFLPQDFQSVFPLSAREILATGRVAFAGLALSESDTAQIDAVIHSLQLTDFIDNNFNELSGGATAKSIDRQNFSSKSESYSS